MQQSTRPTSTLDINVYLNIKYPLKCDWVFKHVYGSDISKDTIYRESIELWDEVKMFNIPGIQEEFIQVYMNVFLYLYKYFSHWGFNPTLWGCKGCIQDFVDRIVVWHYVLRKYSKPFSFDYFREGNNWKKPSKVQCVLSKAGVSISLDEATSLVEELLYKFN